MSGEPKHIASYCPYCNAEAQELRTDSDFVSWCANGHITIFDDRPNKGLSMVYDFSK